MIRAAIRLLRALPRALERQSMRLAPRMNLPTISDEPRAAWLNGWWSGNATGCIVGLALAVLLLKGHI